ncbi:MAG: DUF2281 domain-containing protein [Cyanobacteria bacterium P01_D01_bin.1]
MTSFEQIQQDIQTLPQEALDILAQFIQLLKKGSLATEELQAAKLPDRGSSTAILQFLQKHPFPPNISARLQKSINRSVRSEQRGSSFVFYRIVLEARR